MNGIGTGLLMIAIGAIAAGPPYVSWRRHRSPFVEKRIVGGYNGVVGVGAAAVGVLILVVSVLALTFG